MADWANYDDVLEQLQAFGLDVQSLEVNTGRPVRCRTSADRGRQRTGWYVLHELRTEAGELLLVGAYGDWREGVDPNTGRPVSHRIELKKRQLSPQERAAIRARINEDRKRAERARIAAQQRAARRAEKAWAQCGPVEHSDYLQRKGVGDHGLRRSPGGNLVIPIHDANGKIHGLQVIYEDPETKKRKGRDKDFWPAGLAKRGHFFLIGTPTWLVLVAEGYATAASLHEATGFPVAVAFDAGNLLPVCQQLQRRYREARILVCADDDWLGRCQACGKLTPVDQPECEHCGERHGKTNTGVTSASAAALAVDGAWVAPHFADRGRRKLTDFNDLHQAEGLHVVRSQIEQKLESMRWRQGGASARGGAAGEAGDEVDWVFTIDTLLDDYTLIYGTETVFDGRRRRIIGLSSLRAAAGKSLVRMWLEHPDRKIVLPEQVGFDPTESDPEILCNLWNGWPTVPRSGSCERLLELLQYLCSGEDNPDEVYQWILKWLAYPIQHPGTKMQTALLMHGPEGTGKNTFFGCIRRIYGKYGGIFDQTQLESQFNGWASGKLFMIGNEVVTRAEIYHQQGRLKNMITETEWQINEKNLPTRLEANHCNFVFFSNRIDIAKLDKEDRRYCVVWTPPAVGEDFYIEVAEEIRQGGVEALHDYLLNLDLGEFNAHTKPPITRAKRELIEMSMDSVERFWLAWIGGELPLPVVCCRTEDLYSAYRLWAQRWGIPRPAPQHTLIGTIAKKPGVRRKRVRHHVGQSTRQSMAIFPPGDLSEGINAVTDAIDEFRSAFDAWREDAA